MQNDVKIKPQVTISGDSGHSSAERQEFVRLLTQLLMKIGEQGQFDVKATGQRFAGRPTLKGLSVAGMQHNLIVLGYQTAGNDTRYKYYLSVPLARLKLIWQRLKDVCGTSYQGELSQKQVREATPKQMPQVAGVIAPAFIDETLSAEVDVLPADKAPNVFFTRDQERLTLFMVEVAETADRTGGIIAKDVVIDLLVKHAGLPSRFKTGPMLISLVSKGWLVPHEGDTFRPDTNPPVKPLKKKPADAPRTRKRKPRSGPIVRQMPSFAQPFLQNDVLMQAFFAKMGSRQWTHTELTALVREQYPKWTPQAVGHVFGYLCQENFLERVGAKMYRSVYGAALQQSDALDSGVGVVESAMEPLAAAAASPEVPVVMPSPESSLSNDELAKLLMRLDQVEQLEAKAKADALTIAALKRQVEELTAQLANVDARVEQGVNAKLAAMLRAKL